MIRYIINNTRRNLPANQSYIMGNGVVMPYNANGRLFENANTSDFVNTLLQYLAVYEDTSLVAVIPPLSPFLFRGLLLFFCSKIYH
jgi:hypothetical protein